MPTMCLSEVRQECLPWLGLSINVTSGRAFHASPRSQYTIRHLQVNNDASLGVDVCDLEGRQRDISIGSWTVSLPNPYKTHTYYHSSARSEYYSISCWKSTLTNIIQIELKNWKVVSFLTIQPKLPRPPLSPQCLPTLKKSERLGSSLMISVATEALFWMARIILWHWRTSLQLQGKFVIHLLASDLTSYLQILRAYLSFAIWGDFYTCS